MGQPHQPTASWQLVLFIRSLGRSGGATANATAAATTPPAAHYVGSKACATVPRGRSTAAGTKTPMANVVRHADAVPSQSFPDLSTNPVFPFTTQRRRVRLRQHVEAALLHEGRRRLLPAAGAVGRRATRSGGRTSCRQRTDWWTPFYPPRQHAAADRPDVRRLPLGRLRHPDEAGRGVERRLRALPRAGQRRTSRSPTRDNIVNPARMDAVARQRHVHPVPLAGAAAARIRSRASTTTGRSATASGCNLADFWQLEDHTLGADRRSRTSPTARRTRTGCRGTTSAQSLMYRRGVTCFTCHDVHGTDNYAQLRQAGDHALPAIATARRRRTVRTRRRSRRTRITRPAAPAASASRVTCRRSRRSGARRHRPRAHLPVHPAGDDRSTTRCRIRARRATPTRRRRGRWRR